MYDIVSVITGLFFCYVGFLRKNDEELEDTLLLQEPLLNSNCSSSNRVESSVKSRVSECVTPYSNAGLFSILGFSWMASLIVLGNKRTLDPEDVPRLDSLDSIYGVFPVLQNKLEAVVGVGNRLTTIRLAKVLFFSAWKEILFTAILALLYTLATYVGSYLIDNFVQYLSGRQAFEYEGYVLVSPFFIAQLVECFSERHRFFQVQQVGIRFRAALVAMIYNEGLTLSCQAKQGNTSGEIINLMAVDAVTVGDFSWDMHDPWLVLVHVAVALLILSKNTWASINCNSTCNSTCYVGEFSFGKIVREVARQVDGNKR